MTAERIALSRDDLCLAFANTLSWRGSAAPAEALGDATALLDWLAAVRPIPPALRRRLRARPAAGAALLATAIALRESLYRIFSSLACGDRVAAADLALLNRALAQAPGRSRLAQAGEGWAWSIAPAAGHAAAALLAPVLWSAGDLLAGAVRGRIRRCANDQCLWLFLDQSKSGTRRWCDMAACGNRAKARRHYMKARAVKARGRRAGRGATSAHGDPTESSLAPGG
jgi:predicted RNA-binding Zn ribbon-like protein